MSGLPAADARSMLWRFAPMIYGPTFLWSLGEGSVVLMLPVIASSLGADLSQAAAIAATLVVARLFGNIPAGWAVSRLGERGTMLVAAAVGFVGMACLLLSPHLILLGAGAGCIGLASSAFGLARHSFMTTRAPLAFRARALSLLGGSFRLGMFVGPFVAAGLLAATHAPLSAVWFALGALAALTLLVAVGRDPAAQFAAEGVLPGQAAPRASDDVVEDTGEPTTGSIPTAERQGVLAAMWRHRRVLAELGLPTAALSGVRQARLLVLPLWGVSIGVPPGTIALVVALTGAIEFALFYASGQIMDRFGRIWACLPAMVLMGAAFLVLALTHDLPAAFAWYVAVAVVIGTGNGLSSGILLTLGADAAPPDDPTAFLGAWRTLTDAGGATASVLVTALTAAATLSVAAGAVGLIALAGGAGFLRYVPKYAPRRPR